MIKNKYHREILESIVLCSGKATQHTFLDSYLGNANKRYPISVPVLRTIAKEWMKEHRELSCKEFTLLLTSLVRGESSTEKCMAGILLEYSAEAQRQFDPALFDSWLDHMTGWAEVDTLCTGDHTVTAIPARWTSWKKVLIGLSKSDNINKRRASIVLLCSPLQKLHDERLAEVALKNIDRLKGEKEILITKAISWVLRSMVKYYRDMLTEYLDEHEATLPRIAVRETRIKLATGRKS